ncbi:MAG: type II secretion system F family protein [Pirellulaceae bacterium]
MPEFVYIARTLQGERITGEMSAGNEREVITALSVRDLFPVEVSEQKEVSGIKIRRRPNSQAMTNFYTQLASLLSNGVPLMRSLEILKQQSTSLVLRDVIDDVAVRIEDGMSIGDAFARHPKVFNDIAVNMSRAGSEGGFLEDALERVGNFTEQQADLRGRTVGALIYPIVLFTVGTLIVGILLTYFVPLFGEMFQTLRDQGKLPWLTDALLNVSAFLRKYGFWALLAIATLLVVLRVQLGKEKGRRFIDGLKLKLPLFGTIVQNLAVARFCRVLGTLLGNGVPILKALEISRHATSNIILSETIEQATENITAGESLASPLQKSGQFPQTVTEMISVAEESNTLDTVLVSIADGLENRTSRKLDLMVRLLEPLMLLVMAIIILLIVIALIMPIMNMGSAFV